MLPLVILSRRVCFSPSTMALFHCQRCWFFFCFVFGYPHFPWVWLLIQIAAYIWTNLLSDNIVAIYPSSEACFWTCPLQWQQCRRWRPILQRYHTSIPSSCRWRPTRQNPSRIIIWRCDSARRWENLRDMASTLLGPSMVRLLSTPQLIGDRGIYPINSYGLKKVSGAEGNYESVAVFTGR